MTLSAGDVRKVLTGEGVTKKVSESILGSYATLVERLKSRGVATDGQSLHALKSEIAAVGGKSPAAERIVRRFVAAGRAVEGLAKYDDLHAEARKAGKKVSLPKNKRTTGSAWQAVAGAYASAGTSTSARFEMLMETATSASAARVPQPIPTVGHPWGDFGVHQKGSSQKELEAKVAHGGSLPPIDDLLQSKTDKQLFHEGKKTRQK